MEVYRWSDGSYLEDQDFWRLSGIYRDVYLRAENRVAIDDLHVQATLDDNYREWQAHCSSTRCKSNRRSRPT